MTLITTEAWKIASREPFDVWSQALQEPMFKYGIDKSKERIAMFLAQASHESGGFSRLTENLNYSAIGLAKTWPNRYADKPGVPNKLAVAISRKPELIANHAYSNRMGNGTPESGDGWKYRGRGIFQLTGKANYQAFFYAINEPEDVDKLSKVEFACKSACWFWSTRKLNEVADTGDVTRCTKIINGGTHGLAERTHLYNQILKAL